MADTHHRKAPIPATDHMIMAAPRGRNILSPLVDHFFRSIFRISPIRNL